MSDVQTPLFAVDIPTNLVREGIRALLEKAGDIDVVGEAVDGQEAVEITQKN